MHKDAVVFVFGLNSRHDFCFSPNVLGVSGVDEYFLLLSVLVVHGLEYTRYVVDLLIRVVVVFSLAFAFPLLYEFFRRETDDFVDG